MSANRDHRGGWPGPPLGPPCPEPEPEPEPGGTWTPGGRRWPPLLPLLPLDPEDELPAFGFWFGPVGNEPCALLLLLLPPLPPPRAIEPETGASRATPTVAVATSMMLNRFVIIVAPVAGDKYNYRSQMAAFLSSSPVAIVGRRRTNCKRLSHPRPCIFVCSECGDNTPRPYDTDYRKCHSFGHCSSTRVRC